MERLEQKYAASNNVWGSGTYHAFFKTKTHFESQLGARYNVVQYE